MHTCSLHGYPFGKKGYKLLNFENGAFCISRDVIFHESVFPFAVNFFVGSSSTSSPTNFVYDSIVPPSPSPSPSPSTSPLPSPIHVPLEPSSLVSASPSNESANVTCSPFPSSMTSGPVSSVNSHHVLTPIFPASPSEGLRKSTITHVAPSYLNDYICSSVSASFS